MDFKESFKGIPDMFQHMPHRNCIKMSFGKIKAQQITDMDCNPGFFGNKVSAGFSQFSAFNFITQQFYLFKESAVAAA